MENTENIPQQEPEKISPFADSPYVMEEPEKMEHTADIQEGVPCVTKEKRSFKGLKICAAILGVIALVVAGCCITAHYLNNYWKYQSNRIPRHRFPD